jgi:hypothetical protein
LQADHPGSGGKISRRFTSTATSLLRYLWRRGCLACLTCLCNNRLAARRRSAITSTFLKPLESVSQAMTPERRSLVPCTPDHLPYQLLKMLTCFLGKSLRCPRSFLNLILLKPKRRGSLLERPMKTVLSVAVAVVMPFGFFVLAGVVVGRIIAKHRETRSPRDAMRKH